MAARLLFILTLLSIAGCGGGGANILPEPFTRERADGKIPVKTDLIRQQVQRELGGMPEGEAEVARWQQIETDYNACRLSSRGKKSEVEKKFANCMSQRGYVYMYPVDAEQLHNDIAFEMEKERDSRIAAERKAEEDRIAAERKRQEELKRARRQKELDDALIVAVRNGDSKEEARLIAEGANPQVAERQHKLIASEKKAAKEAEQKRNDKGLAVATESGNADEVLRFLTVGANPDAPALVSKEMAEGFAKVAKAFGKDVSPDRKEDAPLRSRVLRRAAWRGHTEVVKILLAAGANPDGLPNDEHIPLVVAAQDGHTEIVKMLLDAGANPNHAAPKGKFDSSQYFALEAAAQDGHTEIIKMLLDAGANIEDALHNAAASRRGGNRSIKVVEMLLAAGANVNKRGSYDNSTPLHQAAEKARVEIVEMLIAAGADVNAYSRWTNPEGGLREYGGVTLFNPLFVEETPLHRAAEGHISYKSIKERQEKMSESIEVIRLLLAAGADIHAFDEEGNTPMHDAAEEGYYEIVKFLLAYGADPNAYNKRGETACEKADSRLWFNEDQHKRWFYNETKKVLREAGAKDCP